MTRLPVHCCCNPGQRLGSVDVPQQLPMNVAMFQVLRDDGSVERVIVTSVAEVVSHVEISPEMSRLSNLPPELLPKSECYLAVKSNHEPLDVWRRVHGFSERR